MTTEFQQTPLFQLNLMLWLAWYPLNYEVSGIRPIFLEEGFEIQSIGASISLPTQEAMRAGSAGLMVNRSASPDLIIKNEAQKLLVPIECKQSSFGPKSDGAKQAYVLLSATGPRMANYFGLISPREWTSFLLYGVEADNHLSMYPTLDTLANDLSRAKIESISSGAMGIAINGDKVYLQAVPHKTVPISALNHASETDGWVEVMNFECSGDPTPLSLIPVDPSIQINDDHGNEVLERKLRASITSAIGGKLDEEAFTVTEDEIMRSSIEVWDMWQDSKAKSGLMKSVRKYLRTIFAQIRQSGVMIDYQQGIISFRDLTSEGARSVRQYLLSAAFRRGAISWDMSPVQLDFDDISDDWK